MADNITPFSGKRDGRAEPMNILHRFIKSGGRRAEIRERKVTPFRAIEFLVFVDGLLLESQMFHGAREAEYPDALKSRIAEFIADGWSLAPAHTGKDLQ
jgi:hypothetical protein